MTHQEVMRRILALPTYSILLLLGIRFRGLGTVNTEIQDSEKPDAG